jgi:hypothetical protein
LVYSVARVAEMSKSFLGEIATKSIVWGCVHKHYSEGKTKNNLTSYILTDEGPASKLLQYINITGCLIQMGDHLLRVTIYQWMYLLLKSFICDPPMSLHQMCTECTPWKYPTDCKPQITKWSLSS